MPLAYRAVSPNVQRRSPRPVTWRLRRRKSFAGHDFNQGARLAPRRPRPPAVSDSGGRCALSRPHHGAAEGQLAALDQGGTDLASTTGPGWAAELIAAGQGGVVPLLAPAPEGRSEVAGCPRYARCGNTRRRGSEPVSGDWGGARESCRRAPKAGYPSNFPPDA